MIKDGYTLFVTKVNGTVFRKQAKSAAQFIRMCVADEKANGFTVPRAGWYMYEPDFIWREKVQMWQDMRVGGFCKKIPAGYGVVI